MSVSTTVNPENRLWGIYHTDREYAHAMGDPLRTTIEAPTKSAVEEAAARLGFSEPWAHPIAPEIATLARSVLKRHPIHRRELTHKPSRGIRI